MAVGEADLLGLDVRLSGPELLAWSRFYGQVVDVVGVNRVGMAFDGRGIDLWVLLDDDSDELSDRLFDLYREYLNEPHRAVLDLHVHALDMIDESHLPTLSWIYAARREPALA